MLALFAAILLAPAAPAKADPPALAQASAAAAQAGTPAPAEAERARSRPGGASYIREEDYRVARIGYRIGVRAAALCAEPHPLIGLLLHHLAEYARPDQPEAARRFGIDRGPGVLAVVEGSPAARAGLVAGDVLLEVNGAPFPSPVAMAREREGKSARLAVEATELQLEQNLRSAPARLAILRAGAEREVTLGSLPGCPARVRLARSPQMNAFAHRGYAIMTTILLGFLRSDDELAVVLGHEIAHNILRHPEQLEAQGVPYGFLRGIGKNASRVRATEEEADRLGLRLVWAAGFDVNAAIPYWRRYYGKFDVLPQLFRTHPGLRAREKLIAETIAALPAGASDPGAKRP